MANEEKQMVEALSSDKAKEYLLSRKRVRRVCDALMLAILALYGIVAFTHTIIIRYHFIWAELTAFFADLGVIIYLVLRLRREKKLNDFDKYQLDGDALLLLQTEVCRYYYQLAHIMFALFPVVGVALYKGLHLWLASGDYAETFSYQIVLLYVVIFAICLFLLTRAGTLFYSGSVYMDKAEKKKLVSSILRLAPICAVYWTIVLVFLFSGLTPSRFGVPILAVGTILYYGVGIVLLLTVQGKRFRLFSYKVFAGYGFLILIMAGLFAMYTGHDYLHPYIATVERADCTPNVIAYDRENGRFTISTEKENFRILQLSDIHLGGSLYSRKADLAALQACRDMILGTKPDLVVVTGDIAYAMGVHTMTFDNYTQTVSFAEFMERLGIPWAFTYGNHDTEFFSSANAREIDEVYRSFSVLNGGVMLYPDRKPDAYGRCNQSIVIENPDGSVRQVLFLLDSNNSVGTRINNYEGIHQTQIDWYEAELHAIAEENGKMPDSLLYTHIPIWEFQEAYSLYLEGGDVELCSGRTLHDGATSIPTQPQTSRLFDKIKECGSTKAVFCGHLHATTLNMMYQNVRLCFGMSIDYSYITNITDETYFRGGVVVTLASDGSCQVHQQSLDALR